MRVWLLLLQYFPLSLAICKDSAMMGKNFYFPNFPKSIQEKIAKLYHNPNVKPENLSLDNFTQRDEIFCENTGIYGLDLSIKELKNILNKTIDDIINDKT